MSMEKQIAELEERLSEKDTAILKLQAENTQIKHELETFQAGVALQVKDLGDFILENMK